MPIPDTTDRRSFLSALSAAMAGLAVGRVAGQSENPEAGDALLGQGAHQWRVVPGWGVLDEETPVRDCHAMVQSADGRIFLLTNEVRNNVIIYDREGRLLGKWGTEFPGAHGLTLAVEGGEEVLYLTDHARHQFFRVSLEGRVLRTWDFPEASGKYDQANQFQPTHVALAPDGGFVVVDGYGRNWCHRYDERGDYMHSFGGNQGGGANLECAHGAWVDTREASNLLWVTSRSESKLKRFTLEGELVDLLDLPGCQPNFIVPYGDHTLVPHLRGADRGHGNRGFLSVLDPSRRVVSNLAAAAPEYEGEALGEMGSDTPLFTYPHGILIDDREDLYVAQWNSGRSYPIKLERVRA